MNPAARELSKAMSEYREAQRELDAARRALAQGTGDAEPWRRAGAAEARLKAAAARLSQLLEAPPA